MSKYKYLKALITSLACVAISAHAFMDEPVIPEYSTKDYAVYVYHVGEDDKQLKSYLFGSDGYFCHLQMINGKYKSVGGQWKREANRIHINYHAPKRAFFGLWNNWAQNTAVTIDLEGLIKPERFVDEPFLLGFGNDKPNVLAIVNPKIHDVNQPIPQGTKNVFIGEAIKGKNGYILTAISLENYDKIKLHQEGNGYFLSLSSTSNTLSTDEIAKQPKTFEIKDNVLILNKIPDISYISNDTNTDVIMMANALQECQGENPLRSLKRFYEDMSETPQEKAIIPFLVPDSHTITYQGTIDDGKWLKRQ